jgi:hypothetical protein
MGRRGRGPWSLDLIGVRKGGPNLPLAFAGLGPIARLLGIEQRQQLAAMVAAGTASPWTNHEPQGAITARKGLVLRVVGWEAVRVRVAFDTWVRVAQASSFDFQGPAVPAFAIALRAPTKTPCRWHCGQ